MPVLADAYQMPATSFTWRTSPMTKIAFRGGKAEAYDLAAIVWCLQRPDVTLQPRVPYDERVLTWLAAVPFPGPKARIVLPDGTVLMPPTYARSREDGQAPGRGSVGPAEALLRELLADGPMPTTEVLTIASGRGISERTVRRAARMLQVEAIKRGFREGWAWHLLNASH